MPLETYVIHCCTKDCPREAQFKIASRWSDGITGELKTYSLCCTECLPECLARSREKQAACRLAAGETLEAPVVFRLRRGVRDRELERVMASPPGEPPA
jgi:hypothetical protein